MEELARVLGWLGDVAAGKAAQTVDVPGGVAYLHPEYPVAQNMNFLRLTRDEPALDADGVDRVVRAMFGGTEVDHRVVEVHHAGLTERLDAGLQALGYSRDTDLVMLFRGQTPSESTRVVELSLEERANVAAQWRRQDHPEWPEHFSQQLGDRVRTLPPVAECTFFAVKDDDGKVVSMADLYRRDGLAQVEEVVTLPEARNQGHAQELVKHAVIRAGDDIVFLIADADDWPANLYRKLGFEDLGTTALFIDAPTE